jgi:predicted ATP-grasp superfamily ATP-dependent carboligase
MAVTISDRKTPVLVLNAIHHGALGLNRSLGRLGVKVYNQAPFRSVPAFHSRYSAGNFLWDQDKAGAAGTVEFLLSVGRRIGGPALLIATCDVTATLLADYDESLRQYFVFPRQRPELVHALCSKKGLYELARSQGIPTPETSFPASRADVLRFLESARFPIVLKTVKNVIGSTGPRAIKLIIRDEKSLLKNYDQFEDPNNPNLMLQEYVPGCDETNCMFNGYFNQDSTCLVSFTGKKIRQYPAYAGVTSLGMCSTNEAVDTMTRRFMKAIGYRGIVDLGFRFDARDEKYKIYDVNPRIGATFRLFVDTSGLDVARTLYLDMTGQPVEPGLMREGRKWVVEDADAISGWRYYRDGKLQLNEWISSLRGVEEGALFASDDWLPVVARSVHNLRKPFLPLSGKLPGARRSKPRVGVPATQASRTEGVAGGPHELGRHTAAE